MNRHNIQLISILFAGAYLMIYFFDGRDEINKVQSSIWCATALIIGAM